MALDYARQGPPTRGDVVYGPNAAPAVVIEDADRDGNLVVLLTVGQDAGQCVPLAAAEARRVTGHGVEIRVRAARDYAWTTGHVLPARPQREVAAEGSRIAAAPVHGCIDVDLCRADPWDGKPSTGCGATDRHLAALRREYRAATTR